MTSVVMFSNINEPLLTVLKEKHPAIDLTWLMKQGSGVSEAQKNIVRADCNDQSGVHLMTFPQGYHLNADHTDPRWSAWSRETGIKTPSESYAHGGVNLYVY